MSAGVNPRTGFTQVMPTAEEKADWDKRYPRQAGHYPYRSKCSRCGKRIWHSGIAIGSHRRACPGAPVPAAPPVTEPAVSAQVPEEIATYFEGKRERFGYEVTQVPQIVQVFLAKGGWTDVEATPATFANTRSLKAQGAVTLGVTAYDGAIADFPIEPMLRKAGLPLLGGALIGSKTK